MLSISSVLLVHTVEGGSDSSLVADPGRGEASVLESERSVGKSRSELTIVHVDLIE